MVAVPFFVTETNQASPLREVARSDGGGSHLTPLDRPKPSIP